MDHIHERIDSVQQMSGAWPWTYLIRCAYYNSDHSCHDKWCIEEPRLPADAEPRIASTY